MRSFVDGDGRHWQVALLDASYGSVMLVFSPLRAGGIRCHPLAVATLADAMAELAALDEDGLLAMLAAAEPWDSGADAP